MNTRCLMGMCTLIGHLVCPNVVAAEWRLVPIDPTEHAVNVVVVDPSTSTRVLAATSQALYESQDRGTHWEQRWTAPGDAVMTHLTVSGSSSANLLVATTAGVYGSFDEGRHWQQIFGGIGETARHGTWLATHSAQPGTVFLGTREGLFISTDHGRRWSPLPTPAAARDVVRIEIDPEDPERLYLLAAAGLFIGRWKQGDWEQLLGAVNIGENAAPELEDIEEDVETDAHLRFYDLALEPQAPATVYVATSRGLQRSTDHGKSWHRVSGTGLDQASVRHVQFQSGTSPALYTATTQQVACYDAERNLWVPLTSGFAATPVNDLAANIDGLWAATSDGLYYYTAEPSNPLELLSRFEDEPTIGQVREAAIRYAEVHPDKITRWRRQASLQALLPTFDLGYDRGRSRDTNIDEGSFPNFQFIETEDHDDGFDVSLQWDLGNLIWNDDQTSIDVRSKLMVQLRDDIVDEVTRAYFERRRLQLTLLNDEPTGQEHLLEQELRLQELTAVLDGLTGGYFSRHLYLMTP